MLLRTFFDAVEMHREDKFVSLQFRRPFRVISTAQSNGGVVGHLDLVYNHQCCEAAGHDMGHLHEAHRKPAVYDALLLADHGLDGVAAAGLGTAANMNNLCIAEESFRDLVVVALATGGAESNAARAGDPAGLYEAEGRFERRGVVIPEPHGTINVMVAVNKPMTEGALVRAVMTATEAKAAVLQELSVPSRQSAGIATGTGTDQIAVMAPAEGAVPLMNAGHHATLGELIGRTVHRAIKDTLGLQNGLTPTRQCSCGYLLERFGVTSATLIDAVADRLPASDAALARRNLHALDRDPLAVAATASLIHAYDQTSWGVLPPTCWQETAIQQGALIAVATAGRPELYGMYCTALAERTREHDPAGLLVVVTEALTLGLRDKWGRTTARLAKVVASTDRVD